MCEREKPYPHTTFAKHTRSIEVLCCLCGFASTRYIDNIVNAMNWVGHSRPERTRRTIRARILYTSPPIRFCFVSFVYECCEVACWYKFFPFAIVVCTFPAELRSKGNSQFVAKMSAKSATQTTNNSTSHMHNTASVTTDTLVTKRIGDMTIVPVADDEDDEVSVLIIQSKKILSTLVLNP